MSKKHLLLKRATRAALLFLLLSVAGVTNAVAQTFTVGNLNYSINEDGATVTVTGHVDGTAATGELVIPESVEQWGNTYTITYIGGNAFDGCSNISSVTIGSSVTTIGVRAFQGCYGLTSITIPSNVTFIYCGAFHNCTNLTVIQYDAINCSMNNSWCSEGHWMAGCSSLNSIIIGNNVQVIPDGFAEGFNSLTSVSLSNSIISIGNSAFRNCSNLSGELIIPNSVISIGDNAFENCSGYSQITIGNNVNYIGNNAFSGCSGFTGSLSIPNNMATIGSSAFLNCSGFTGSLSIPNNVAIIGSSAFMNCSGFSGTLTLGASLTQIDNSAFFGACANFTSINVLAENPPTLGNNVFVSANYDMPVQVPCGFLDVYQNADGWSAFTNLQHPEGCVMCTITATANPSLGGAIVGIGKQTVDFENSQIPSGWSNDGSYPWYITNSSYEGSYCMMSGNSWYHGTTSSIETTIDFVANGVVEFYSRVSSENNWDFGYFYIDDVQYLSESGNGDWGYHSYQVTAGSHVLRWTYGKDSSNSHNNDCYFIDNISFHGISNNSTFITGDVCSLNAIPSDGYTFGNWTENDNVVSTEPELTFTVTGDRELVANFNAMTYSITAMPNFDNRGSISGTGEYEVNQTCTLTATPAEGHRFSRWTENGEMVSTDSIYSFIVTGPRDLVAVFSASVAEIITFADPNVEAICVANWDTDGDGFLSYDEAAAVTDIGGVFNENTEITSFDEFRYFIGLTYINGNEFWYCNNLASVTIPIGVTYIEEGAFGFTGLTSLTYNATNCSVSSYWLYGCYSLINLTIGDNVQVIPDNFVPNQSNLVGELVIPTSVTYIGSNAFSNCSGLIGTLVISNSVTNIGEAAFANTGITGTLTIGTAVTSVGGNAFQNCTGLTGIIFNATNCTSMGYYCNSEYDFYYYYGNGEYYTDDPYCNFTSAFSGCSNITSLQIGEGVQTIPNGAFRDLTGITGSFNIPNSVVTIGDYAFAETNLGGVLTIPENVTSVGLKAFAHTGITSINFNATNCTKLGYLYYLNSGYNNLAYISAFYGCTEITSLQIGDNVLQIPTGAFKDLQGVSGACSLPNSLETIGNYAFDNIGITGVLTIPKSVISIGSYAFSKNDITTVNFNATNCTEVGTGWYWSDGVDIAVSTFYSCNNLTTLNIGSGVQTIPNYAFVNCAGLAGNLSLPNSLISIGENAFFGCSGFSGNLAIPNAVETIGNNAFKGCTGLGGTLTIGESVTTIHGTAFTNTNFSTMNYNATNCVIGGLVWDQWHDYQYFVNNSFSGMPLLTTLNIGNNVESISQMAFKDLTTLTGTLTLPNSLTTIGDQAFYNCYGFEGIVMGNSVETIGAEAFRNCGGISGELTLPESLVSVGPSAFMGCNEISAVNYNAINCETMGNASQNVFGDCLSLTHIRIGANVESIPNYAFKPCFLVTDMSVAAINPPVIEASTFGAISRSIPVSVPFGSGDAYRSAQYWEEFFNITEDYSPSQYTCHWNVDIHQFEQSMTAVGIIQIDGVEQTTDALEIGAFCGNECRGRQLLAYYPQVDRYLVFLTLYGEDGDEFSFRLYDHETSMESAKGCSTHLTFVANDVIGTLTNPHPFNFVDMQQTQLVAGWNWWSSYVELTGIDGLGMVEGSLGENGEIVKSQNEGYASYLDGFGWYGSLVSINNESTYLIKVVEDCEMSLEAAFASPANHPVTLNNGWNWIGYPTTTAMSLSTALSGFEASDDDLLKAQEGFAMYYTGLGWIGSLRTLTPGVGLMYKSNNGQSVTLTYPTAVRQEETSENITTQSNHWTVNAKAYPHNMNIVAVVEFDGTELQDESYEIAAFANGEVRGSARLLYIEPLNRYMAFLTVAGDEATELQFSLYNAETGEDLFGTDNALTYTTNAVVGSLNEPYIVSFRGTTGVNEFGSRVSLYPNPVASSQTVCINLPADNEGKVTVEVINAIGAVLSSETTTVPTVTVKVPETAGVYMLRISSEGNGTCFKKLVVR